MMKSENEIPKYDLAEQIMAGQRKFAARKRIAPIRRRISNKDENENVSIKPITIPNQIPITANDSSQNTEPKIQKSLEPHVLSLMSENIPDQIISDIVARDIQNFRKR